jgi:hypothetical protein
MNCTQHPRGQGEEKVIHSDHSEPIATLISPALLSNVLDGVPPSPPDSKDNAGYSSDAFLPSSKQRDPNLIPTIARKSSPQGLCMPRTSFGLVNAGIAGRTNNYRAPEMCTDIVVT